MILTTIADFRSYIDAQQKVNDAYGDTERWDRMSTSIRPIAHGSPAIELLDSTLMRSGKRTHGSRQSPKS